MNIQIESHYRDLFDALLHSSGAWRTAQLTSFSGLKGNLYNGELLVVGRAVNGWKPTWTVSDLSEQKTVDRITSETIPKTEDSEDCPMAWVSDCWGATEGYNTKKSAFWRTTREVVRDLSLADVDDDSWPSFIAWSNLYKISPANRGNPSDRLADIQFSYCSKILKAEICALAPRRILFLTGLDWAHRFLAQLDFVQDGGAVPPIASSGPIFNGSRVAILPHPQGKAEQPLVSASVDYFKGHCS